MVLIVAAELLVRARLEGAARAAGVDVRVERTLSDPPAERPRVVVLDVRSAADLDGVGAWRARWPDLRMIAVLFHVDETTAEAARALGCEVVSHFDAARLGPELFEA